MPVIKSAIKKLRQSLKHQAHNRRVKLQLKELVNAFKKSPTADSYAAAVSALDKAVKTNIIHKNKASRLKGRLARRLPKTEVKTAPKPLAKKPRQSAKKV